VALIGKPERLLNVGGGLGLAAGLFSASILQKNRTLSPDIAVFAGSIMLGVPTFITISKTAEIEAGVAGIGIGVAISGLINKWQRRRFERPPKL